MIFWLDSSDCTKCNVDRLYEYHSMIEDFEDSLCVDIAFYPIVWIVSQNQNNNDYNLLNFNMSFFNMSSNKGCSKIVIYFFCCSMFYGCNNPSTVVDNVTVLSSTSGLVTEKSISEIDLISDIELVSLQNDSVIMGEIDKIVCSDSLIYIMDMDQRRCIDIFSRSGNYLNTLSRFGRGRGEYTQLKDFFIDKDKSTLNILDRGSSKILVYDLLGRTFMHDIRLPKRFGRIRQMGSGYLGYMCNYSEDEKKPYNIWTMDSDFEIQDGYMEIDPSRESRYKHEINIFSSFHDECQVVLERSNDVYSYSNGDMIRKYVFDFGELNLPKIEESDNDNPETKFRIMNNYIQDIYQFQETESKILAMVLYKGQYMMVVYDKSSKSMQMVSLDLIHDDDYFFSFGDLIDMDENHIYSIIGANRINPVLKGHSEYIDYESLYPNQVKNLRDKLGNGIDPDGNPILAIYHLK